MPYRLRNMSEEQMLVWLETQYDLNENGCWVWRNSKNKNYGYVRFNKKPCLTHRLYWLLSGREIPDGLELCHAIGCDKACYNPEHLRADTRSANSIDRYADDTMTRKLTVEQVRVIRADTRSLRVIGEEYGIRYTHISKIKSRQAWSWVI